jgi:hypothetical protein
MRLRVSRKRREFATPYKFFDKDSDCIDIPPFNDPNFSLARLETNVAVQVCCGLQLN